MVELSKEEQEQVAKDIAAAKERIEKKEKAQEEVLKQAKEEAKKDLEAEQAAKEKAENEAKEKEELQNKIKALEDEKKASEESYKQKLDSVISSQAVVSNKDPFAGGETKTNPSGKALIESYSEEQVNDIETRSRQAFEAHLAEKQ